MQNTSSMLDSEKRVTLLYMVLPLVLTFSVMFGLMLLGYEQNNKQNSLINFCISNNGQLIDWDRDGLFSCKVLVNNEATE